MTDLSPLLQDLHRELLMLGSDSDAMLLSELDGLIAGLHVCPELIPPSAWLPAVWGDPEGEGDDDGVVFDSLEQAQRVTALVLAHYNAVAEVLRDPDQAYEAILDFDESTDEAIWQPWVSGFVAAMRLGSESWFRLFESKAAEDEEARASISLLAALHEIEAHESDLELEMIEELSAGAPDLIPRLVETLHDWRLRQTSLGSVDRSVRSAKVGRNEPCPCGSGRKYKKCCGAG